MSNSTKPLDPAAATIEKLGKAVEPSISSAEFNTTVNPPSQASSSSEMHTNVALSRKAIIAMVAGFTLLIGGAGFYLWRALTPKANTGTPMVAPAVVTVELAPVKRQLVDDTISVTGTISPWDPITVSSETSGLRVNKIFVEEGEHVKKGQMLASIYSGLLDAQLAQAKARLLSSKANLSKAIQPNRSEDIAALKDALAQAETVVVQEEAHKRQAEANLQSAESNEKRYIALQGTGAISEETAEQRIMTAMNARQEVLSAERKVESAKLFADQAKQRYAMAVKGGREEDVAISKANIAEIEAQIQHLAEQIKQTNVIAPDDGVISHRNVHIGDTPSAGSPLFSMIRLNKLELRAQVTDLDISKFSQGQEVYIAPNETSSNEIRGHVNLIYPQVDASTRLGTVRISLPENSGLKPGMFVRGEVKLGKKDALTVPVNSVVFHEGEAFVFTVEDKRAIAHKIKTGARLENCIEVKEGLTEQDKIIDKGARFLNDHDVVRLAQ